MSVGDPHPGRLVVASPETTRAPSLADAVAAYELSLLSDALRASGGNQSTAARNLGLGYHQLRRLLKKHEIHATKLASPAA